MAPAPVDKDNMDAVMFAENACQYYAIARFAMYAQRVRACALSANSGHLALFVHLVRAGDSRQPQIES